MAVTTVTLQGKVLGPDGVAPSAGTVSFTLSQNGKAMDGATAQWVGGSITTTLTAGAISCALVPNDLITPAGTNYKVDFRITLSAGVYTWTEYWQLASGVSPIDIGAVTRVGSPATSTFIAAPNYWDLLLYLPGTFGAGEEIYKCLVPRPVTIPASCVGSRAVAGVAPTGTATFLFKRAGSTVITLAISTGNVATWTLAAPLTLSPGDILTLVAPASADATLADVSLVLVANPL